MPRRASARFPGNWGDDTNVVADADVKPEQVAVEALDAPPSDSDPGPATLKPRAWSMPKPLVTREQADEVGRTVVNAGVGIARLVRSLAGSCVRALRHVWRAIEAVPPAVRSLFAATLFMLLGVAGSIALHNGVGLICAIVVVPVCSVTLGVLGHRWYSGLGDRQVHTDAGETKAGRPELQRSVQYVDNKLALALSSLGTERHQQAVIALFQAKTAVELALGTELQAAGHTVTDLLTDDQDRRPRIQAGDGTKQPMQQTNSLAAS